YSAQMWDQSTYDTLVTLEAPDFTKIQPKLAERWEISKDGLTYTFHLRGGAKFHSGNPVTANDVRFSFRRLKYLEDNPSFFMDPVKDIQALNDTTVKVTLSAPDASWLAALAAPPTGILDSKTVIAQGGTDGENAKTADKATSWLNEHTAGSGPYELTSFRRNEQAVLYAIDYDGIIKGLVRDAGVRPPAMFPLGVLGVDPSMARQRDAAKAKQLLAEADYPNGFNVKLNYWTAPLLGVPPEPLAAKLQADLGAVGIKVTLEPKERSVMISEYRAGKPQLMLASWSPDYLDPHPWADAFYRKGG